MTLPLDRDDQLVFLPLGGSGEIGMNLNLYQCAGKWIMVDLGINFADDYYPGIDLLMPDPSFIEDRSDDLLALILTHGHEDHIGAVAHLWPRLRCPIYATPFTAELVKGKLAEHDLLDEVEINLINDNELLELGPFQITYLPIAHSIAEGNALLIETSFGRVFHTGDWKLDERPVVGTPTSPEALTQLGDEGILAVIGDSTNVLNQRASGSESDVHDSMLEIIRSMRGRVVVTTFASNVSRIDTVGRIATETGRRIVPIGRSMHRIISAAKATGYLKDFPMAVELEHVSYLDPDEVLILATGCQGEPRAAVWRMANDEHRDISLDPGDNVIFSSKIIPGNGKSIARLVNRLVEGGINVITEKDAFVHVSGHPGAPELAKMYEWLRPEILIPVHGEVRHMTEHAALGRELGIDKTLVPRNGMAICLAPDGPQIIDDVPAMYLALDGKQLIPADAPAIAERRRLALNGACEVFLVVNEEGELAAGPVVNFTGVPGHDDPGRLIGIVEEMVDRALEQLGKKRRQVSEIMEESVRIAVRRRLKLETGKKVMTRVRVARLD